MRNALRVIRNALRCGSFRLAGNELVMGYQALSSASINYIPTHFSFAITFRCNLRCPTCQYLLNDPNCFKSMGYMEYLLFESVFSRFDQFIVSVGLSGGEPTLHPELSRFVGFLSSKGCRIELPTNGILIDDQIESLSLVNKINVSLDAYDEETFKKNRGGSPSQWENILRGLELMKRMAINFRISFLIGNHNIEQMVEMLRFADQFRPEAVHFHSFNPQKNDPQLVLMKTDERIKHYLAMVMERTNYEYNVRLPTIFDVSGGSFKKAMCSLPWNKVYINENGDLAYCCHLKHASDIGNVNNDNCFNSKKMVAWRKMLIDNPSNHNDCVFCERRFMNDFVGFNKKNKKWFCFDGKSTNYY